MERKFLIQICMYVHLPRVENFFQTTAMHDIDFSVDVGGFIWEQGGSTELKKSLSPHIGRGLLVNLCALHVLYQNYWRSIGPLHRTFTCA